MKKTLLLSILASLFISATMTAQIDLDGDDDSIAFLWPNEISLGDFGDPFTFETWFMREGPGGGNRGTIFNTISTEGIAPWINSLGMELYIDANDNLQFDWHWYNPAGSGVVNLTTDNPANPQQSISYNRWYHVAITYDGTTINLYVDGVHMDTGVLTFDFAHFFSSVLRFGCANTGGPGEFVADHHFNGVIDETRIWSVALSEDQIRQMMNQEIRRVSGNVRGRVVPLDIPGLSWGDNLEGYYRFDSNATDRSTNGRDGTLYGNPIFTTATAAPLPYNTTSTGIWDDADTWLYGNNLNLPNGTAIDGSTPITWNIVKTSHRVSSPDRDLTLLGLKVVSNTLSIVAPYEINPLLEDNTGHSLEVTHYLKINGTLDLVGQSQLLQGEGSILDSASKGSLQIDQQGTKSKFMYNYWSSPVVPKSTSSDEDYSVAEVMLDGTTSNNPKTMSFVGGYDGNTTDPISIAYFWIYTLSNLPGEYSNWMHVGADGGLKVGEGYTMKGVMTHTDPYTDTQNYVYEGLPNNGDYTLTVEAGNHYLIGNPYPSAINADQFIADNASVLDGTLYFWDHLGGASHNLAAYIGGYASYNGFEGEAADPFNTNLFVGVPSPNVPRKFIPVGQAFFVIAHTDGEIVFNNGQREFEREGPDSVFLRPAATDPGPPTMVDTREKIRLNFMSPAGYNRKLLVGADPNATDEYDSGYDASAYQSNPEDIFWLLDDYLCAMQGVSDLNTDRRLPLSIRTNTQGQVTIEIDELMNIPASKDIYLLDKHLEVFHDLRTGAYQVDLDPGYYDNRFELVFEVFSPVILAPKAYLQGAAINPNPGEASLMRDDLRIAGYIPTTSPYADAMTCDAAVFTTTGSDAIVDWVWVELRDASNNTLVVESRSALLQRDGDIVATDGTSALKFYVNDDNYYVVINHRNHLGVMSKNAIALNATTTFLDLSISPSDLQGDDYAVTLLDNGKYGMYGFDTDGNGQADLIDYKNFTPNLGQGGYQYEDLDLNGQVQTTDQINMLAGNYLRGEQFETERTATTFNAPTVTYEIVNAGNTSDANGTYYEADIQITGSESLRLGDGVLYFNYNTAAFGSDIAANANIEFTAPTSNYIFSETVVLFGTVAPFYSDYNAPIDQSEGRIALRWRQSVGTTSTVPGDNVATTSALLVHLKITYGDDTQPPLFDFESDNNVIGGIHGYTLKSCLVNETDCVSNYRLNSVYSDGSSGMRANPDSINDVQITDDIELSKTLSLYPNPTDGIVHIKGDIMDIRYIEMFNSVGILVKQVKSDFQRLDVSDLDPGAYFVQIHKSSGDFVETKTLLKN